MKTIFEPAKPYFKLLGEQKVQAGANYRLMTFVVQAAIDDGLLLLHNMTKEMVLLSQEEQAVFEQRPTDLPELISHWFLVPEEHDDCQLSLQLRNVARLMAPKQTNITGYTVMTTSDCNARCFYCYELGQTRRPMTEQTYNRVKAFIYKGVNAYETVMQNIGHLLAADIAVSIRMNIDMHNADDLERLAEELHERFKDDKHLSAYLHLLFEDNAKRVGACNDDKRRLLMEKMRLIEDKLEGWGLFRRHTYEPMIKTGYCMADNDGSVVIQPDGYITKCEHYTDSHHVGHINQDGFDAEKIAYFKEKGTMVKEFCRKCVKYPDCMFLLSCPNFEECYPEMPQLYENQLREEMKLMYKAHLEKGIEA